MSKFRILMAAVVVLVLLNIVLLAVLWKPGGHPHPPHRGVRNLIIERLHFDKAQIQAYDVLVGKHFDEIGRKDEDMRAARRAIYRQLSTNDLSKSDSLLAEVGRLQIAIEQVHLAHFQEIKKLCRGEQLAMFDGLSTELDHLFSDPKKRPRR